MIRAGINITHTLDKRFGLALKQTLSQRDVPGISRAAVPLLNNAGVPFISIGVHGLILRPFPSGPFRPRPTWGSRYEQRAVQADLPAGRLCLARQSHGQ